MAFIGLLENGLELEIGVDAILLLLCIDGEPFVGLVVLGVKDKGFELEFEGRIGLERVWRVGRGSCACIGEEESGEGRGGV